jgi:hypothetical protein
MVEQVEYHDEMGRACGTCREQRSMYRASFGGETRNKEPLAKRGHSWVDNIKFVNEVDWEGLDCCYLAENRDKWQAALGWFHVMLGISIAEQQFRDSAL